MDKFKKYIFLGPSKQHSEIKYFSNFTDNISSIYNYMNLFPKMSDTTKMVSCVKWVKYCTSYDILDVQAT